MTHHTAQDWAPAPRQGLVPLYPYGFGTILGKAFAVLKGNPKVLLLFVVGVQTVTMTLSMVIIGAVAFWAFSRAETVQPSSPDFAALIAGSVGIVLLATAATSIALVGITVIAQGIVVAEVAHASLGEKARLRTLWGRVKPAFWRLVGYSLLLTVAALLVTGVITLVVLGLAMIETPSSLIVGGVVLVFASIGVVVLYAWLGTKLYLAPSAIILEGAGPVRGIARSWALTRGRFWQTFGVIALLTVITQFAGGIISGVFSFFAPLIGTILAPLGLGNNSSPDEGFAAFVTFTLIMVVVVSIVGFAIASIMTIVTGSGGTLAYIDARMRDEGIDLRMRRYVESGGQADDPYTFIAGAEPSPYGRRPAPQPAAYPQPAYPQPGYSQPGYPQPGYAHPGYAPPGYPQPGYAQPGAGQPQAPQYPPQPGYPQPGPGQQQAPQYPPQPPAPPV